MGKIISQTYDSKDMKKLCEITIIMLLQNPKIPGRNIDKMRTLVNELCCKLDRLMSDNWVCDNAENMILLFNQR